jgi:hypothetical protein
LLEIVGFFLVAYELFRTQRREFGDPKALKVVKASRARIERFFRRLLRKPSRSTVVGVSPASSFVLANKVKLQVRRGSGRTLEDHVFSLEKNFALLDKEVGEHRKELNKAIADLGSELRETRAELERQRQAREEEQREFLRASVPLQWCGIGLFVLGALFSGAANVLSCS